MGLLGKIFGHDSDSQHSSAIARVAELLRECEYGSIGSAISRPARISSAQQVQAAQLFIDALKSLEKMEGPLAGLLGTSCTKSEVKNVTDIIGWLLGSGLNPNAIIQGEPLAHAVIDNADGSLSIEFGLEMLILAGADVNATSSSGKTVLGSWLSGKPISFRYTADSFFKAGATFNQVDLSDHKLYETIFQYGLFRAARAIPSASLAEHANLRGENGYALLHLAAGGQCLGVIGGRDPMLDEIYESNGHYPALTEMLLQAGADISAKTKAGHDAMSIAVRLNHMDTAKVLEKWSKDAGRASLSEALNTAINSKATPLFLAAFDGNLNDVEKFLEHGADPNIRSFVNYDFPAEDTMLPAGVPPKVASLFFEQFMRKLQRPDSFLDISLGLTNLHYPCLHGYTDIVHCLLEAGENPNARSFHGIFPLYVAAEMGHLEIVMDLIAHGADIDQVTPLNCTALLNAAEEGHVDVVLYLLSMGADPSIANAFGSTPLDGAIRYGHADVAAILSNA